MRKVFLCLSLFIVLMLACDLSVNVAPPTSPAPLPTVTLISATVVPTQIPASPFPTTIISNVTPTEPQSSFDGAVVFYRSLSLVIPPGLASGISGNEYSRSEGANVPAWEVTPGHIQLTLEGYLLQEKSQQAQILVYPATAYGEMYPGAFESIHRLTNIIYSSSIPISSEQLPAVPFFNAQQIFASNVQLISFQNGKGVRFLTEYSQYAASANNHDLFYQFQGLTDDGSYIIAILPITVPILAETSDGGAALPLGGIPYPYFADPQTDMQGYYTDVTALLNVTPSEAFSPTITKLDVLIQSMKITP